MTITAIRELRQNSFWMRFTVTAFTFWYHFMFFLMTFRAQEITMFRMAHFQHLKGIRMAGSTTLGWHFCAISDCQRHMRLMTHSAVIHHHEISMTIMTFEAIRQDTMFIMTAGT